MDLDISQGRVLRSRRFWLVAAFVMPLALAVVAGPALAACTCGKHWPHVICRKNLGHSVGPGDIVNADTGGHWMWMRSPEQERRVAMTLFNRYCIRCHSVDGRGVWDIPDVPDFANVVWQNTRPDEYRSRVILEGRGAVMPSFRGIITVEESWALARYLHSFLPGNEVSRPGLRPPDSPSPGATPAAVGPATTSNRANPPAATTTAPNPPAATTTAPSLPAATTTAPNPPAATTTAPNPPAATTTAPNPPGATPPPPVVAPPPSSNARGPFGR